jgi:ADP-dependent NAD(P)H-hydrate dehydratase / NAD(P)H-hydrate epimerase
VTENISWLKQSPDKPLFPDLLWIRPENRAQAGKLLIVGGNLHGFSAVGSAFGAAEKAGVGVTRVLLPDKLRKTLSKLLPEAQFAPSTPSGSFSTKALSEALEAAAWADGVLTNIMLEALITEYKGPLALTGDSLDYFLSSGRILDRENTAVLADFGRLQAMAKHNRPNPPLTHNMGLYELVKALAQWSSEVSAIIVTYLEGSVIVAAQEKVSTTPVKSVDYPKLATFLAVWQLQNTKKLFEMLSCAVFEYKSRGG